MCRLAQASAAIESRRREQWIQQADLATEFARIVVAAVGAGIPTKDGVNPLIDMAEAIDFAGTRSSAPEATPMSERSQDEILAGLAPGGLGALLSIFREA